MLGLVGRATLAYDDPRRNLSRQVRVDDGRLAGVRLAGDLAAEGMDARLLPVGRLGGQLRQQLLAGSRRRRRVHPTARRVVCNCFNVAEARDRRILCGVCQATLRASSAHCGQRSRCGTNWQGPCLPELRTLVDSALSLQRGRCRCVGFANLPIWQLLCKAYLNWAKDW